MNAWDEPLAHYAEWLRAGGCRDSTVRLRLWSLRKFAEAVPDPWAATLDQMASYVGTEHWGPEARRAARSALRSFYKWAKASGRTDANPSKLLPTVRVPRGVPRPTPETVLTAALERADDRERLMIMLAAYAGLRCMEIAGARFDDVRGDELFIRGKGGKVRVVPLHPALVDAIAAEQRRRQEGRTGTGWRYGIGHAAALVYLFPGGAGKPITAGNVSQTLSRLLGPGFTGHTLRHRFASQAYAGTRDLRAVQTLLGHAEPETTARYTAVPDGALLAAVMVAGPR